MAEKRREFRGKRRLLNRWHCRRKDLKQFFGKIFRDNFLQEFEKFAKNTTNLLKYDEAEFFNPYVIRYQALGSKVELIELLHILFHISKYRGYKSFYQDDNLDEMEQLRSEISKLEKSSQTNNNSEKQKELAEKRKRLNELEKGDNNTSNKPNNNNLVVYLSVGGITVILFGIIIALWSRQRKKILLRIRHRNRFSRLRNYRRRKWRTLTRRFWSSLISSSRGKQK